MAARLVLVRHGRTEWSVSGQHTGRTDMPLLEEGRADARLLGKRLAGGPWPALLDGAAIRTSPLVRAAETCELAGLGGHAEPCGDLMEWDYGGYEGMTPAQIRAANPGWVIWRDGVPGGEALQQVSDRADRVVTRAREAGSAAVFAHGHILRVIAARWLGLDASAALNLRLAPASLSVLESSDDGVPALALWNDTAHLEHRG